MLGFLFVDIIYLFLYDISGAGLSIRAYAPQSSAATFPLRVGVRERPCACKKPEYESENTLFRAPVCAAVGAGGYCGRLDGAVIG